MRVANWTNLCLTRSYDVRLHVQNVALGVAQEDHTYIMIGGVSPLYLTIRGFVDQLVLLFGQDVQDLWVYTHRRGVVLTDLHRGVRTFSLNRRRAPSHGACSLTIITDVSVVSI